MSTDQLTEQEALAFGQRLDDFARGLTAGERNLLTAILHDAASAEHDSADRPTLGDMVVAIHRSHRTPPISLNPLPVPVDPDRFTVGRSDNEKFDHTHPARKE